MIAAVAKTIERQISAADKGRLRPEENLGMEIVEKMHVFKAECLSHVFNGVWIGSQNGSDDDFPEARRINNFLPPVTNVCNRDS